MDLHLWPRVGDPSLVSLDLDDGGGKHALHTADLHLEANLVIWKMLYSVFLNKIVLIDKLCSKTKAQSMRISVTRH